MSTAGIPQSNHRIEDVRMMLYVKDWWEPLRRCSVVIQFLSPSAPSPLQQKERMPFFLGCISFLFLIASGLFSFFSRNILDWIWDYWVVSLVLLFCWCLLFWGRSYTSLDSWQFQHTRRLFLHSPGFSVICLPPLTIWPLAFHYHHSHTRSIITHCCMPSMIAMCAFPLPTPASSTTLTLSSSVC